MSSVFVPKCHVPSPSLPYDNWRTGPQFGDLRKDRFPDESGPGHGRDVSPLVSKMVELKNDRVALGAESLVYSKRILVDGTSRITSCVPLTDGLTSKMIGRTTLRPTGNSVGHAYEELKFASPE